MRINEYLFNGEEGVTAIAINTRSLRRVNHNNPNHHC